MLDKERVGKTIAFYRKEQGMTQKELADRLHISYQAVSKWEVGAGIPTVEMFCELSSIFHVSIDVLINDTQWDNRVITYRDVGLDTKKLNELKRELLALNTKNPNLLSANYADAAVFQMDLPAHGDLVYSMLTCVPGSKEQPAILYGYDREICMDTAVSGMNHLLQHGMKPVILKANVLCSGERHDRLRQMAQGFRDICEENDVMFAGMEISAQPLNYRHDEFHIHAGLVGVAKKEDVTCLGNHIQAGDVIIGIHTDGIDGSNYPFIKVMADKNKNLFHERLANGAVFIDEFLKANTAYTHEILALQKEKMLHGMSRVGNRITNDKICIIIPEELGVCIDLSAVPVTDLYRFLYQQDMIGRNVFHYHFHFGIGMLVIVAKEDKERAMEIISQYHPCYCIGSIEKCRNKNKYERIWTKGEIQW